MEQLIWATSFAISFIFATTADSCEVSATSELQAPNVIPFYMLHNNYPSARTNDTANF